MMNCALNTRNFIFKTRNCVSKTKNYKELHILYSTFCIKNDEFRSVIAAIDSGMGGSRGNAPRKFARPCPDCDACQGYPCFKMMDIDADGVAHKVETRILDGARTSNHFVAAMREHFVKRKIQPQEATTMFLQNQVRSAYEEFNAEKVGDVDKLLEKYSGKEAELLASVKQKYELPAELTVMTHVVGIREAALAVEREEMLEKARAEAETAEWEAALGMVGGGEEEVRK